MHPPVNDPPANNVAWQPNDRGPRGASPASAGSLKLMETHAQTHWRAAAWLLERQNPEEYARKAANSTRPQRVDAAFRFLQENALAAVPEEFHAAIHSRLAAAAAVAFDHCFPALGPWDRPAPGPLPFETPFWDRQNELVEREAVVAAEAATDDGVLSPKTYETTKSKATESNATKSDATKLPPAPKEELAATRSGALPESAADQMPPTDDIPSPEIAEAAQRRAQREERRRERRQLAAAKQARRDQQRAQRRNRAA